MTDRILTTFAKIITGAILILLPLSAQIDNQEFRSTWVITWDHSNAGDSPSGAKARIRTILDRHAAAQMNAVIFQIRQGGNVYFNSSYEPWGFYVGYAYPGFDPLEYLVQQAHKRGIEAHAWFNVFQCSSTYPGSPAVVHPDWVCRDGNGNPMTSYRALSPGLREVREYTVDVAMEIVNNYDIDGLHLDYVRWNEHTSDGVREQVSHETELRRLDGFASQEEIQALQRQQSNRYLYDIEHPYSQGVPSGFTSWEEWWRWSVTEFVSELHDSIEAVKPHVRLSAAVLGKYNWSGWQGYGSVYQDAALWFNQGDVDQLMPMHYHWTTASGFYGMLTGDCPNCWSDYIQPGITAGRLFSVGPGSYILDENNRWGNHPDIVNTVRLLPWVDGFQFFAYQSWQNHSYWSTAGNTFFAEQTKIRSIPGNAGFKPVPPQVAINKVDLFNYELTITPSDTNISHWFVIYRAEGETPDSSSSTIVSRQFQRLPFTYTDTFSGEQEYGGEFHYSVTQADRHWNESALSNLVQTDSIPTTAPPSAIHNLIALNPGDGTVILDFDGSGSATHFQVISSNADYSQIDTLGTYYSNPVIISGLSAEQPHYLQVRGINEYGHSPFSNRVVVATSDRTSSILIVNDFEQIHDQSGQDYLAYHADAILAAGFSFDATDAASLVDGSFDLSSYAMVDWILGNYSQNEGTISIGEQAVLTNYLENGGHLLISGMEIGWDLVERGNSSDREFYHDYLKAEFVNDWAGGYQNQYLCDGTLQGMFIGKSNLAFDDGTHGTYNINSPDGIKSYGGSTLCLEYTGVDIPLNGGAAVQYKGKFGQAEINGGVVHLAVPFEAFYPAETRNTIMSSIIDYFEISPKPTVDTDKFAISTIYPNPLRTDILSIRINALNELSGELHWSLFDLLGRQIRSDNLTLSSNIELYFNVALRSSSQKKLSSGIYFIKVRIGDNSVVAKFTYLK